MSLILRDAGLSELVAGRRRRDPGRRVRVHRGAALVPRRLAPVPGHQGRADLPARAGRLGRGRSASRPARPTARPSPPTAGSSSASRTAAGSRGWTPTAPGVETVVETWSGKRLNSPNDIVCRSDGLVYFTDPPYGVAPEDRRLHFQGVYALDSPRRGAGCWPTTSRSPTAWRFSPDERTLYVCDTGAVSRPRLRRRAVGDADGRLGPGLRDPRPRPARRPRRHEGRSRRPGLRRRGPGRLGLRGRRHAARDPRACRSGPRTSPGATPTPRPWRSPPWISLYRVRLKVAGILPPFTPRRPDRSTRKQDGWTVPTSKTVRPPSGRAFTSRSPPRGDRARCRVTRAPVLFHLEVARDVPQAGVIVEGERFFELHLDHVGELGLTAEAAGPVVAAEDELLDRPSSDRSGTYTP